MVSLCSYQLQKYRDAGSFVVPIDPNNKDTWGDSEHRLAQVSETTVIHSNIVKIRDEQWWRTLSRGYMTQWAAMHPQQCDVLFYAHSLSEVADLAPMILRFRATPGKKAYVVVTGGAHCPCEEAAVLLGWSPSNCHERRFKIFDLEVGSIHKAASESSIIQEIFASMKGLIRIHNPSLIFTVSDLDDKVRDALKVAASRGNTTLVQLPRASIKHALWIPDVKSASLRSKITAHLVLKCLYLFRTSGLKFHVVPLPCTMRCWCVSADSVETSSPLTDKTILSLFSTGICSFSFLLLKIMFMTFQIGTR